MERFQQVICQLHRRIEGGLPLSSRCPKHDVLPLFTCAFKLSPWFWNHSHDSSPLPSESLPGSLVTGSLTNAVNSASLRQVPLHTPGLQIILRSDLWPKQHKVLSFSIQGRSDCITSHHPWWAAFSGFYSLSGTFFSQANHPCALPLDYPTSRINK